MTGSFRKFGMCLAAAIAIMAFCAAAHAQRSFGSITGLVIDAGTKKALAGAKITAAGRAGVTDKQGRYRLLNLPTGTQNVSASASGRQPGTVAAVIQRNRLITAPTLALAAVVAAPAPTPAPTPTPAPPTPTPAPSPTPTPAPAPAAFQKGVNFPWWNYGTDFGTGPWGKYTDWNNINAMFAALHVQGATHIAWQVMVDGRYSPDFRADGTCYLDAQFLPDIDHALLLAHNNGLKLLLNLMNPQTMFGAYNANFGAPSGGHAAIITDPTVRQSFLNECLTPMMQRIAASPYHDSVYAIDILAEPEWNEAGYGNLWPAIDSTLEHTFVQMAAQVIHQNAPGVLTTVGSATPYWVGQWKGLGLDFYDIHYYPSMDFGGPAGSGLPAYATLGLDKPCIVGEYPSMNADNIFGSILPLSGQWYLDTIKNYGYAGSYAWAASFNDGTAANWVPFQPVFTHWATGF